MIVERIAQLRRAAARASLHTLNWNLSTLLALALAPASAWAGTNGFLVPAFRGAASSQSGYWETFTTAHGAPGNAADQAGATTTARLYQTDTNAFLTGSGNIYNMETSAFSLVDSAPYSLGTVALQTRTIGSELDYSSVALIYTNESGAQSLAPLFRLELDRASGQGVNVSSLWQWDLRGLAVSNYSIAFHAGGPSLSFDSLTLDTAAAFTPAFVEQPFRLSPTAANIARWNYPFNANPASRPVASVFGSLGSAPDFDSRDAQFLLGWDTAATIPAGLGSTNYALRRARVTLTLASGGQYAYTGAPRDYRSYFPTNDPRYVASASTGCPVELFGVGFRGGYTAESYPQDGPWAVTNSTGYAGQRVAYAAGFDTQGALVDVASNVGDDGTNEIANPFEVAPFAFGQATNIAEGELMPLGSQLSFEINLDDPLICRYLQSALDSGHLRFMATSLISASRSGPSTYPSFYTSFSPLAAASELPNLEIEGAIIRPNVDADKDGLPDDWENFYFGSLQSGANDDSDGDGLSNRAEFLAGTNPKSAGSAFRLTAIQPGTGATELRFTGGTVAGAVQWSDDLGQWQTITAPAITYSSAWLDKSVANPPYPAPVYQLWRDTNAPGASRFYRLTLP